MKVRQFAGPSVRWSSEGEGDVAVCSAKRWDRRNRADLIEFVTSCHDAQVLESYRVSNPLRLTVLAPKSEDYTIVSQHLPSRRSVLLSVRLSVCPSAL